MLYIITLFMKAIFLDNDDVEDDEDGADDAQAAQYDAVGVDGLINIDPKARS